MKEKTRGRWMLFWLLFAGLPIFGGLYLSYEVSPYFLFLSLGGFLLNVYVLMINSPGMGRDSIL